MGTEIERKFLVRAELFPAAARAHGASFVQGYLSIQPSVRLRISMKDGREQAWLTVKGPGTIERAEFEYAVPPEDARAMLALAKATLSKTRHRVPVGAHTWDVDEFHGAHAGLWLAEVELARADEAFEQPPWLGEEVSHDPRYTNSALALAGRPP